SRLSIKACLPTFLLAPMPCRFGTCNLSLAVVYLSSLRSFIAVLIATVSTRLGNLGLRQYLAIFEAPPPPIASLFTASSILFPHWPTPRISTLSMISASLYCGILLIFIFSVPPIQPGGDNYDWDEE